MVDDEETKLMSTPNRHAELVSASIPQPVTTVLLERWTLEPQACLHKQVQGDDGKETQ
jgi:hypothetical protein